MSNKRGSLRSVERAIGVLEVLAARGEGGVTEVASEIAVTSQPRFGCSAHWRAAGWWSRPGTAASTGSASG